MSQWPHSWHWNDLTLLLDQVAEGYRAMDERRAIKALLRDADIAHRSARELSPNFVDGLRDQAALA